MIAHPVDKIVDHALHRLRFDRDFQTVMGWMEQNLSQLKDELVVQVDHTTLHRVQGAASAYRSILEAVEQSGETA